MELSSGLLFVYLCLFYACSTTFSYQTCPARCVCHLTSQEGAERQGYRTDCSGLWLTAVPFGISPNTTELDLSQNAITAIHSELENLVNLEILELDANLIQDISPGAFRTQTKLKELYLQNNWIKHLEFGIFHGLQSLEKLEFYNSRIETIDVGLFDELANIQYIELSLNRLVTLPNGAFKNLNQLKHLSLTDNELILLGDEAFCNLTSLMYLNLRNNHLTTIPEGVICGLSSISSFILLDNVIECDCEAKWLYDWLIENQLSSPFCSKPPHLIDRNLISLFTSDFCEFPTASIQTNATFVLSGMSLMLTCIISGNPFPGVFWSKDGDRIIADNENIFQSENELIILNMRRSDSGQYYCTASSQAGADSSSITINVIDENLEFIPTIINTPESNIQIPCITTSPVVNISSTWDFNSILINTSESSRHVILPNGDLIITGTQFRDSGDYFCKFDSVTITREVRIEAPAKIIDFPEPLCINSSIILDSRIATQLVCTGIGNPIPTVQWFRNFIPIMEEGEGGEGLEMFTVPGVYHIPKPSKMDEGKYICLVQNSLGEEIREINVVVRVLAELNTTSIQDVIDIASGTLSLPCNIDENEDMISILWQREDEQALPSTAVTAIDGNLIIVGTTIADSGVYECVVEINSGIGRLKYNVTINAPPSISQECQTPLMTVLHGQSITLTCNVTSFPISSVQWFIDGKLLQQVLPNDTYDIQNSGMTLIIARADDEHGGLYTCKAKNQEGIDSYSVLLDVLRRPFFTYRPSDTDVNEGYPSTLHCAGAGNPKPIVEWFLIRDDYEIKLETTGRIIISEEFLTIIETWVIDAGIYHCSLNSSLETELITSYEVFLTVWTSPLLSSNLPTQYTTIERHPITLLCSASGDPLPAYVWRRNDTRLPIPGRHFQDRFGRLRIYDPMPEDEGIYVCQVINIAGDVSLEVFLTVQRYPSASVTPSNTTSLVGCIVLFTCLNNGAAPKNFTWVFKGSQLTNTSKVTVRPTGDLIIRGLSIEHSGVYTCTVYSELGSDTAKGSLIVLEVEFGSGEPITLPTITETTPTDPVAMTVPVIQTLTPTLQVANLGSTVQFVCIAEGVPTPIITWTESGIALPNLNRIQIEEGLLTITGIRTNDAGTYECTASNIVGSAQSIFTVNVNDPPEIIFIPDALTINAGETIRIQCNTDGDPVPLVVWSFNGNPLLSGGRVTINENNELEIVNTNSSHSGEYTCVATNAAGIDRYTALVSVEERLISPTITTPPLSLQTQVGESFNLMCVVDGLPTPQVMWLKDGAILSTDMRIIVNDSSVSVSNSDITDSGVYTCTAMNLAGVVSHSVLVTVFEELVPISFTILPESVSAMPGEDIVIDCQATGFPVPTIIWGTSDNFTQRVSILENGTLIIMKSELEDSGQYYCEASNTVSFSRIQINVEIRPILGPPEIVVFPLSTVERSISEDVVIDCQAIGIPTPVIRWLRDGRDVQDIDSRYIVFSNGSWLINKTVTSDSGLYICSAENEAGIFRVVVDVQITSDTSPFFRETPQDQTVLTRSTVTLPCKATGNPKPSTFWKHDENMIFASESVSVNEDGSLVITAVEMNHAGIYTCWATNGRSSISTFAELTVEQREEPPYFITKPRKTELLSGEQLLMHCETSGPGTITQTWLYNGEPFPDENIKVLVIEDGSRLIIASVDITDSGSYTCQARNNFGISEWTAYVHVHLYQPNKTQSLLIGSTTQLLCNSKEPSFLQGITWTKNGHQIDVHSSNTLLAAGSYLWIFGVTVEDAGDYSCFMNGNFIETFYLQILIPPYLDKTSSIVTAKHNTNAQLHCVARGTPDPDLVWKHNDESLTISNKYSVYHNGTLVVHNTNTMDNGQYYCHVSNSVGRAQVMIFLIVT